MRTFTQTEVEDLAKEFSFGWKAEKDIDDSSMHYTISVSNGEFNRILESLANTIEERSYIKMDKEIAVNLIKRLTGRNLTLLEAVISNENQLRSAKDLMRSHTADTINELHGIVINGNYPSPFPKDIVDIGV